MADTKISALASGVPAVTTDLIPIARGTANYSLTAASLLAQTGSLLQVGSTAVGIGTSSPATFLDVSYSGGMARFGGASNNNMVQVTSAQTLGMWAGGNSQIYSSVGLIFLVGATTGTGTPTGGTQTMTLGTNGAVTLAGSSTSASLTVNNTATLNSSAIVVSTAGAGNTGIVGVQVSDGVTTSVYGYTVGTAHFVGTSTSHALGFITGNVNRATISNTGNVTINAPTSGTALTITGTNSTTGIGAVIAGSYTGAGTTQLLSLNDLNNTNGVNLKLTGNGATTPSKTIRVSNGNMEILNDAYSATLLRVVDSGVIQIPAGGAMRIVATTYATIPAAATAGAGAQVWITDSGTAYTGANIGTIISAGGGANLAPLYSDGTNWRIG